MKRTPLFVLLAAAAPFAGCGADPQATGGAAPEQIPWLEAERSAAQASGPIRLKRAGNDGRALCVDVRSQNAPPNFTQDNGTRLQLYACADGQQNQAFTVDGQLVRVFGNKCLNVIGGVNQNGTSVQIWDCYAGDKNMQWTVDNGHLRWAGTDKCLDVTNGKFQNKAPLQIWTCNDTSANQTFVLGGKAPSGGAAASGASASGGGQFGTTMDMRSWTQEVHDAYAFNNEQQNYTNGGANAAFGSDGTLTIRAYPTGGNGWSSARLSGPEMGPLPWYIEADLVAPTGAGSWPAFWLTARGPWPQGGEIDIMEQINGTGQSHISTHWGANTGTATFNTHEILNGVDAKARHRYGVYCSNDGVQFYLDGRAVGSKVVFPPESNFAGIAQQLVPIANVAMGGDWPGYAPQNTGTQTMVVYRVARASQPPSN